MKKFEVLWTKSAEFDLESIIEYIKIDSIDIAKKIFFAIKMNVIIYTIYLREKESFQNFSKLVF